MHVLGCMSVLFGEGSKCLMLSDGRLGLFFLGLNNATFLWLGEDGMEAWTWREEHRYQDMEANKKIACTWRWIWMWVMVTEASPSCEHILFSLSGTAMALQHLPTCHQWSLFTHIKQWVCLNSASSNSAPQFFFSCCNDSKEESSF